MLPVVSDGAKFQVMSVTVFFSGVSSALVSFMPVSSNMLQMSISFSLVSGSH